MAGFLLEHTTEVVNITITQFYGDFIDFKVLGAEAFFCPFDAEESGVLGIAQAHFLLK